MLSIKQQKEVERQLDILKRGVAEIIPEHELKAKIEKAIAMNTPLKVKLGLDPSAPDVHIGHTVVLHKLRQFQDLGHTIQLVIGDFTGKIGDPTGKSETRKQLSDDEIKKNAQTYFEQFSKVIDMNKAVVRYNSEWLSLLHFADVIDLAAKTTVARMLERDDFENRYKSGQSISIHEFFYPLMQAFDSVALESDIELGGTDQTFNLLMGRQIQEAYEKEKQVIMTLPLLEGLDGKQKMSKSLGNYIGISEAPNDMFGKAMSIPDDLMFKYYTLATDLSHKDIHQLEVGVNNGSIHPRDAKINLAWTFVKMYYGIEAADQAKNHFQTVFQKGSLPTDIPELAWNGDDTIWIIPFLVEIGFFNSNGEARRMVENGGIRINEEKITDVNAQISIENGMIVQVGKRKFVKIKS